MNIKQPFIFFRVDAGTNVGMGHVMRCFALAQAWKHKGAKVYLKKGGYKKNDVNKLIKLATKLKTDWVVIDGYCFNTQYLQTIKQAGFKLLLFDDVGNLKHYWANIVLNQNAHANIKMYSGKSRDAKLLLGTDYVMIRDEFKSLRRQKEKRVGKVNRILISFGGSDMHKQSKRIAKLLKLLNIKNLKVNLLRGNNLAQLMTKADLAICSGGITVWELAYMGVPTLIAETSKVETVLAQGVIKSEAFGFLGKILNKSDMQISKIVKQYIDDREKLHSMAVKAKSLIDGRGTERVIKVMQQLL